MENGKICSGGRRHMISANINLLHYNFSIPHKIYTCMIGFYHPRRCGDAYRHTYISNKLHNNTFAEEMYPYVEHIANILMARPGFPLAAICILYWSLRTGTIHREREISRLDRCFRGGDKLLRQPLWTESMKTWSSYLRTPMKWAGVIVLHVEKYRARWLHTHICTQPVVYHHPLRRHIAKFKVNISLY